MGPLGIEPRTPPLDGCYSAVSDLCETLDTHLSDPRKNGDQGICTPFIIAVRVSKYIGTHKFF